MKKTTIIFVSAAVIGALAVGAYFETRRRREKAALKSNQQQIASAGIPLANQKFRGFNFDINLNSMTKQAVPEITALQHMINAYYNGSQAIDITGIFDTQTRNAVKDITGKSSTSLKEFNFQYLIQKRGERVSSDLLTSLTITGKQ